MKKLLLSIILTNLFTLGAIDYLSIPDDEIVELAENGDREAIYHLALLVEELEYKKDYLRLDYINRDMFYWFEKAASLEHPQALTRIAREYLSIYGHYSEKNLSKAIKFLTTASEGGDNEAHLLLALIYYHGLNGLTNKEMAKRHLSSSQEQLYRIKPMLYLEKELVSMVRELIREDNPDAAFILGDFYYFGKTGYYEQSYSKAYKLYMEAAETGHISASYMVGNMLYNGIGVLKDLKESYQWINKSAIAGNREAIIKAGVMNYFGEGTEKNLEEAFRLFSITAEQDDSLSQYFLGVMYYKGEVVERDLTISKDWIKRAYENGSISAKKFWENQKLWE